jgi:hypothetical protein
MTPAALAIAQPSLHGRAAAMVLATTFGIGVLAGLAVPLVPLPVLGRAEAPAGSSVRWSAAAAERAYLMYRAGERGDAPSVSTVGDATWVRYRAGERGDTAP